MKTGGFILRWEALLLALLVVVYGLGAWLSPYFLGAGNQSDVIATQMERALVVLPLTLLIIAGEIDLSVSSIAGLASSVLAVCMLAGLPFGVGLAAAFAAGCAAGALNGVLVAYFALPSMVVTVATLALFRGIAFIILGGEAVTGFPAWFTDLGFERIGRLPLPWTLAIVLPIACAYGLLLHWTIFGSRLFALGAQPEVARFSGVPVRRMKLTLYLLSGLTSALAGLMLTARISSARADNAAGWELPVIGAVLLGGVSIYGGRGTIVGPLIAVWIFGALGNALGLANLSTQLLQVIIGIVLVASVLLTNFLARPGGRVRASSPGRGATKEFRREPVRTTGFEKGRN
jgi:rhamnose transport system permease protein